MRFLAGVVVGAVAGWLWRRGRAPQLDAQERASERARQQIGVADRHLAGARTPGEFPPAVQQLTHPAAIARAQENLANAHLNVRRPEGGRHRMS